jgi:hypothetical protein
MNKHASANPEVPPVIRIHPDDNVAIVVNDLGKARRGDAGD